MAVKITERFTDQCAVVSNNSADTCGTITKASVSYLTPTDLAALFAPSGLFADLDAWFKTSIELKACGTPTYGMYDWLMSGAQRMGKSLINVEKVQKGPSLLFPFILASQTSVLNTDFWALSNGWANSDYTPDGGTGPLTTAQKQKGTDAGTALGNQALIRTVRVVSRYGIDLTAQWFADKDVVHIFSRAAGVAQDGAWKVIAAAAADDASYVDVILADQNAGSSQPFSSTPGASGAGAILLLGQNNVNDFEKWCNNRPTLDGRKQVPFWYQTMRRTRCIDSQYKEYYARLLQGGVNEAFKAFGDLDLAERNRQDEMQYQKKWVHAFFFNKPISASQTLALWRTGLEDINSYTSTALDPGTGGKLQAKRANFIGVKEQLFRCGRLVDVQNNPLNFIEFLNWNYRLARSRETKGGPPVTSIDWYTNEMFAGQFMIAYMAYCKTIYGDNFRTTMDISKGENELGFMWKTYNVLFPSTVKINIIVHKFFNDLHDAYDAESIGSAGNYLLALQLFKGGIWWGQLDSNRVVHQSGDLNKLGALTSDWACVMENITQEVTMTSETGTVLVACPASELWVENFSDAVPITTGKSLVGGLNTYWDVV